MHTPRFRTISLAIAAGITLGCGGDDTVRDDDFPEQDPPPAMSATPGAPATNAGAETTATVQPIDGSGASGTVSFDAAGESVTVNVMLSGVGEGVHQGHIHSGTCEARGGAVVPLEPLTADASGSGTSTSTVALPPATVFNGSHIVVYHEAGGSPGRSVACAQIPARSM